MNVGKEQLQARNVDSMADANETHVSAAARGVNRLHRRLVRAYGLDHRVRAEPIGELLDPGDAFVAPLLDDVGRAVETRQLLALRVTRHRDDPLRAKLPGSQHTHETHGPIADDCARFAGSYVRGHRGEPA